MEAVRIVQATDDGSKSLGWVGKEWAVVHFFTYSLSAPWVSDTFLGPHFSAFGPLFPALQSYFSHRTYHFAFSFSQLFVCVFFIC